jgi:hypothetical protein
MGEMRNTKLLFENLKGRDNLEDLGIDGRILLEWILGKWNRKVLVGFIWMRLRTSGGLL